MSVPDYLNQVIEDLVVGDDYPFPRNYTMMNKIAMVKAILAVKQRSRDGDSSLIDLSITGTPGASGAITDDGSTSGVCSLMFQLSGGDAGDTIKLGETDVYYYGVKLFDTNGKRYTFEEGKILPNPERVKAGS